MIIFTMNLLNSTNVTSWSSTSFVQKTKTQMKTSRKSSHWRLTDSNHSAVIRIDWSTNHSGSEYSVLQYLQSIRTVLSQDMWRSVNFQTRSFSSAHECELSDCWKHWRRTWFMVFWRSVERHSVIGRAEDSFLFSTSFDQRVQLVEKLLRFSSDEPHSSRWKP